MLIRSFLRKLEQKQTRWGHICLPPALNRDKRFILLISFIYCLYCKVTFFKSNILLAIKLIPRPLEKGHNAFIHNVPDNWEGHERIVKTQVLMFSTHFVLKSDCHMKFYSSQDKEVLWMGSPTLSYQTQSSAKCRCYYIHSI